MDENEFDELMTRLISERGGEKWRHLLDLIDTHFSVLSEMAHEQGYGVWIDPTTGKKYEAHFHMQVGVTDMEEEVDFH